MRFSEATGLTLADVDLTEGVLTIRATKFYKSRLAPIGPQLAAALDAYMALCRRGGLAQSETSFLLANRDGTRLAISTVQAAFDALRRIAGVHGAAGGRQIPRLHDLRHNSGTRIIPATDVQRMYLLENRGVDHYGRIGELPMQRILVLGAGGLDAEEIGRAVGPVGSRLLVDVLLSLQRKKLLLCMYTDEPQHRKLYYLAKTTPNISET